MEPQGKQKVYDEIVAHIASDWEDRLFNDHKVPRKDYWRIVCQCYNNEDARTVEGALHELGCDGGAGGGDETTVYVYTYLKGTVTNP
ncbi:hypothetical protein ES703_70414 [subsurface metagenome]